MNISQNLLLTASLLTLTSSLHAANYYVSTNGNDSSPGTSTGAPWRTIQKAANTAPPGSIVTIAGGYYRETVTMNRSGITFLGTGSTVLQGNLFIEGSNLIVNGLTVSPPAANQSAIALAGSHNQLVNCTVVNYGAPATAHAAAISIDGSFNLASGCSVHDLTDIDVFHVFGHDHTIYHCTVYNIHMVNYSLNHTDIFQTWDNGAPVYNVVVDGCSITNCNCQFGNTETSSAGRVHDWTFRCNVFANIQYPLYSGIPRTAFYNNVFDRVGVVFKYAVSLYGIAPRYNSNGDAFINNVFLNGGGNGGDINIHDAGVGAPNSHHNRLSNQSTPPSNFVNEGAFDYHLQRGSLLLSGGVNLSYLFTKDKDGKSEPASGTWDQGPYNAPF